MEKVLQNSNHRGVTCCTNCATVLMFERGVLRMPTDSETEKIEAHPIHALVTLMQTVITSKVAEN